MLYLNGKQLILADTQSDSETASQVKKVLRVYKKLRKGKPKMDKPIQITYVKSKESFAVNEHGSRVIQVPSGAPIPLAATVEGENGPEHWAYSSVPLIADKNGGIKLRKNMKRLNFTGTLLLNEKEIDLIFFLTCISPFCENPLEGQPSKGRKHFMIEDKEESARHNIENEQKLARAKFMIIDREQGLSDDKIREIAESYYIPGINEMKPDEIRWAVHEKVLKPFSSDKIDDFFERTKAGKDFEDNAIVRQALDNNIIMLKAPQGGVKKYALMEENDIKKHIQYLCTISMRDLSMKETRLLNYLKSNTDIFNIVKDRIKKLSEKPVEVVEE